MEESNRPSVNLQFASPLMQALPHAKMCGKVGKSEAGMLGLIWVKSSAKIGGGLAQKRSKVSKRIAGFLMPQIAHSLTDSSSEIHQLAPVPRRLSSLESS